MQTLTQEPKCATTLNADLLIAHLKQQAKKQQWYSDHFMVRVKSPTTGEPLPPVHIAVKMYGKWVQRMCLGHRTSGTSSDIRTLREFEKEVRELVVGLIKSHGVEPA